MMIAVKKDYVFLKFAGQKRAILSENDCRCAVQRLKT